MKEKMEKLIKYESIFEDNKSDTGRKSGYYTTGPTSFQHYIEVAISRRDYLPIFRGALRL